MAQVIESPFLSWISEAVDGQEAAGSPFSSWWWPMTLPPSMLNVAELWTPSLGTQKASQIQPQRQHRSWEIMQPKSKTWTCDLKLDSCCTQETLRDRIRSLTPVRCKICKYFPTTLDLCVSRWSKQIWSNPALWSGANLRWIFTIQGVLCPTSCEQFSLLHPSYPATSSTPTALAGSSLKTNFYAWIMTLLIGHMIK